MASNLSGLGGGLTGFGLGVQQQQASFEAMQNQYSISNPFAISGTIASTPTHFYLSGASDWSYAQDRSLTNMEWLDRRIDEMRVRL